ncbi:MAG: hypothetical protein Q4G25_13295 [Paracoccus sp. (in: a-proteobacteria)]|nr:hypothetical protein [Paracoccus sp. (in: a-proteobacteria)]
MPNFSREERRALSGAELDLVTRSRQPHLRALSDAELGQLIPLLREARNKARDQGNRQAREARGKAAPAGTQAAGGNEGTRLKEHYLAAALRRANAERNKRRKGGAAPGPAPKKPAGDKTPPVAATAAGAAAKPGRSRKKPVKDAEGADKPATTAAARQPATRPVRTGRGGKVATAADRRGSGPRKHAPKPAPTAAEPVAAGTVIVANTSGAAQPGPASTTEKPARSKKPAKPAARAKDPAGGKAGKIAAPAIVASLLPTSPAPAEDAKKGAKTLTEKAARHAAKAEKAGKKAEKAAKKAKKDGSKKTAKAADKAKEKAREAKRKARRSAAKAEKAAPAKG